jgi:agmatine deiminase
MWLGFPSHADLWEDDLAAAQAEVAALARALAGPGGERVRLMTGHPDGEAAARDLLGGVDGIEIVPGRFGDIWLRDTGPIFFGPGRAAAFRFNGWGGKYALEHDDTVAAQIGAAAGAALEPHDFILEGGAVDHDGEGTVLTTGQCLLNPNRNPGGGRDRTGPQPGGQDGAVAGRGPEERPHRRPRGQPGAVRGPGDRGLPGGLGARRPQR